jgi:hypothetical protein
MTITDGGRRPLQAGIEGDFALLLNPRETTMKKLALVAAATVLGMATAFSAAARPGDAYYSEWVYDDLSFDLIDCQDGPCPRNGTQLSGIRLSAAAAVAIESPEAPPVPKYDQRETVQTAKRSANGTHLTGISQLAAHAECQEWACDDLSFDLYNCDDGPCPKNGTQLTGIRLPIGASSEVQPVRKPDQRENLQMARPGQGGQIDKRRNDSGQIRKMGG